MKKNILILITFLTFAFVLQNCGGKKQEESENNTKDSTQTEENAENEEKEKEEDLDAKLAKDVEAYAQILCAAHNAQTTLTEAKEEAAKEEAKKIIEEKRKEREDFDKKMEEKYGRMQDNQELQQKVVEMLKDELVKVCDLDISAVENAEEKENEAPPKLETTTPDDEDF